MKVWIDVDNAPHVQIFRPIIARLGELGAEVTVTARARTFVPELLEGAGIPYTVIGGGQPAGVVRKSAALASRIVALAAFASKRRFDVAVAHGSRSLPPAARVLGIANLTMFDYEHVSTWLFRRFCDRILIPRAVLDQEGRTLPRGPWRPFDGLKEEIYLAGFHPDASIRARLGVREDEVLVVLRPPSRSAHYHDAESETVLAALTERLAVEERARVVWLRRDPGDAVPRVKHAPRFLIPEKPLDGPSLLAAADLAISGGGTMNREAALLGTPAYSIFTGPVGAIDRSLTDSGRLVLVRTEREAAAIPFVKKPSAPPQAFGTELREFVIGQIQDVARKEAA